MSMEDSYIENQNFQLDEEFIEFMDLNSPPITPEIAEPFINCTGFLMEADDIRVDHSNDKGVNTQTYDTTNFYASSQGFSMFEELIDDGEPYEVLLSFKSQQIKANSAMINEQNFIKIFNSAEIPKEPKNYEQQNRKDKVARYISKKQLRNFEKRITYSSRKRVADERLRVGGRFQKEGSQQKDQLNSNEITPKKPRQIIGKNGAFSESHTKSSIKEKK